MVIGEHRSMLTNNKRSCRTHSGQPNSFIDAQLLWFDPDLLEIPAKTEDEPRYLVIGRIKGKHWSAVITYRDSKVRIISVRRSRNEEVFYYEG